MATLSVPLGCLGILSLFGSVLSLGLTYLAYIQGASWAPAHTGYVFTRYLRLNLGAIPGLDAIHVRPLVALLLDQPFHQFLFWSGLILVILAGIAKAVSRVQ